MTKYEFWSHCTGESRSEEHTSELQSLTNLVCRLLLEKKKNRLYCIGLSGSYLSRQLACRPAVESSGDHPLRGPLRPDAWRRAVRHSSTHVGLTRRLCI